MFIKWFLWVSHAIRHSHYNSHDSCLRSRWAMKQIAGVSSMAFHFMICLSYQQFSTLVLFPESMAKFLLVANFWPKKLGEYEFHLMCCSLWTLEYKKTFESIWWFPRSLGPFVLSRRLWDGVTAYFLLDMQNGAGWTLFMMFRINDQIICSSDSLNSLPDK